ncbi:phenylacetic acid degradation protein PaaN [Lacimicrobium alkaliphilum]|uniref:phenylacetic acid degradation protein PaaN n=1 Tax=Lacimicrobium alkaliphilum TaxID=1526571 RepID=UPI000AD2E5F2|nr:phenylacetic acid degradation protein PaaN [Lacimicrobium alkaliphilum]
MLQTNDVDWFAEHRSTLSKAIDACNHRYAWTAYAESPSSKIHGKEPPIQGKANFERMLNRDFPLTMPGEVGRIGEEVSPYTREPLGISYPRVDVETLYQAMAAGKEQWAETSVNTRFGVCLEILHRCSQQLFENAHATMHTSGQSFIMAFAGSGANALDRGLEALAYAYKAVQDIPPTASWQRRFGSGPEIQLEKEYKLMPVGVAAVICCATFPLWNGYPALMASLATGNPVVMKAHPNATLPVAMLVRTCREVLAEAGFDPNLVTLAADTRSEPVAKTLLEHQDTAIVDFTGSPAFGSWIERHCSQLQVYTETAGCNSVVIESTDNLSAMATAIAQSLCQASAQMCTSVQNIHIPAAGIMAQGRQISFDEVAGAIVEAVNQLLEKPEQAAFLCGALVNDDIPDTISRLRSEGNKAGRILRDSAPYAHPQFSHARTATPLILEVSQQQKSLYSQELFGPISFIIKGQDSDDCLMAASSDAADYGAITSHVYSTDEAFILRAQQSFNRSGASLACNLINMPINFAAAYSDFHVTGLNPAGNACLTDLAFVCRRFRVVQNKVMKA